MLLSQQFNCWLFNACHLRRATLLRHAHLTNAVQNQMQTPGNVPTEPYQNTNDQALLSVPADHCYQLISHSLRCFDLCL